MTSSNKHLHITLDERKIIEIGIRNNSTKSAIAREKAPFKKRW